MYCEFSPGLSPSLGIQYIHLYEEGSDLDFNIGLYFYEKLCKLVLDDSAGKQWRDDKKYRPSMPEMLTALVRKQELREKVDVNFDGRISFLEYLLYQYRAYANPADFAMRSMAQGELCVGAKSNVLLKAPSMRRFAKHDWRWRRSTGRCVLTSARGSACKRRLRSPASRDWARNTSSPF